MKISFDFEKMMKKTVVLMVFIVITLTSVVQLIPDVMERISWSMYLITILLICLIIKLIIMDKTYSGLLLFSMLVSKNKLEYNIKNNEYESKK